VEDYVKLKVDHSIMLQRNILEQPGAIPLLFDHHPDGICLVDVDGSILYGNTSISTIFGYTKKELEQKSLQQLFLTAGVSDDYSEEGLKDQAKLAIQHRNGHVVYVKVTIVPLISDEKEMGSLIRFEDISEQIGLKNEISDIQEIFTLISEKSQNIISSMSADGIFTYISPTVKALLGYTQEEVIGKPGASFNPPDTNDNFHKHRKSLVIDQDTVRFTGRVRHKNGEYRWFETTAEFIRDQSGKIIQTIGVGRDITERKEAEEKITYLANHDTVTDLPNRRYFKEQVGQLLEEVKDKHHALMLLDLNGFKYVNDTFGHDVGDQLLIEVAKRMRVAVGDEGIVARWGGDEFTVLQMNIETREEITSLMNRIEFVISEPIIIMGHPISIMASIGAAFSKEDGETVEDLINHADAAMYRAKFKLGMD